MHTSPDPDRPLRRVLRANAAFSGLCALLLLALAEPLAPALGVPSLALRVVGASLVPFAAGLLLNAARPRVRRGEAYLSTCLDGAWVAGSVAVLAARPAPFTTAGVAAIVAVALVVAACGLLQLAGLRAAARAG